MFLFEKLKIWINSIVRTYLYHLLFWTAALFFFIFLTGNSALFINYFNILLKDDPYMSAFLLAVFIATLFTFLDSLFSDKLMRFLPLLPLLFLRSLLHFSLALLIIFLAANKDITLVALKDYMVFVERFPELNMAFVRFMVYFYLSCIFDNIFKDVFRKIASGNFYGWFFGFLKKPREKKRIFMFVDMKSSVKNAEQLGHKKFSYMVQDVFNDLAVVDNYQGAIYQYLGDGAIVSWDVKEGIRNNNCLKAFFAFQKVIQRRKIFYNMRYGMVPEFKAGLHVGDVMVLQVGSIRRDISYNGDTLNTTARIESMCNEYKQSLLISGVLYETLKNQKEFNFKEVGNIKLKGKTKGVQVYGARAKIKKRRKSY